MVDFIIGLFTVTLHFIISSFTVTMDHKAWVTVMSRRKWRVLTIWVPGCYQRLEFFIQVLRVLCPNLTDASCPHLGQALCQGGLITIETNLNLGPQPWDWWWVVVGMSDRPWGWGSEGAYGSYGESEKSPW